MATRLRLRCRVAEVHRFITKNTFEERINDMINNKRALAEMTVSTGENWIGKLSNKELKEIFG
jgi:SNF2 family DNA or RNA helicase